MAIWSIDAMHSEIGFKVKHLVISTVSGKFKTFEGTIDTEGEGFNNAKISFSADIDSVDTGVADRDGHLKSPDFFDATNFPKLSFVSTSFLNTGGDDYELKGNITLKGVTKPISLKVEHGGTGANAYGQTVAGFEITGKINRKDFGLNWSAVTEAGGIVVSDDVKLQITIEAIQQA